MSYDNGSGLNIFNHYGARSSGGTKGALPASGPEAIYAINLDGEANVMDHRFPVAAGCYVTGFVLAGEAATGAVTSLTIGGVEVEAATSAAPVKIVGTNTGVVNITGATAGVVMIKYVRVPTEKEVV